MTRSPLQPANRIPQNNDRRRTTKSGTMQREDSSRIQRERLTRDVLSRQQSSDMQASVGTSRSSRDTAPAGPVVANLTPEQMYSNFEEWIKMATDNKINTNNTWNFALIDYFHEMTFLRDGDSINFQKASVSLDGCVKIYTSRVDSVATETGKLLSGLADSSNPGDGDDDDELHGHSNERRVRRRGNRADSTLLKDFSSIALKKFDLDFAVDPLFKKTSADFDEGGARGLLLNHLALDRECKIIFDASDASIADPESDQAILADIPHIEHTDDEDNVSENEANPEQQSGNISQNDADDPMDVENQASQEARKSDVQPPESVASEDESEQRTSAQSDEKDYAIKIEEPQRNVFIEISRLKARMPSVDALKDLQICPSLQGYNFFSETDLSIPSLERNDPDDDLGGLTDLPIDNNDIPDFGAQQDFDDDLAVDFFDFDDGGAVDDDSPLMGEDAGLMTGENDAADDALELHEDDFLGALMNDDGKELFSYFDSTFAKNWAGPEHWKLRRPISKVQSKATPENENQEDSERAKKKTRQAFEIDFLGGDDVDEEELFATDKRAKITISTSKETAVENNIHTLPDDMHFSSKQLLRLFLKPRSVMWGRKKPRRSEPELEHQSPRPEDNNYDTGFDDDMDFGPDTQYWADQQVDDTAVNDEQPAEENSMADRTFMSGYDDSFYQDSYYEAYDDPETSQYGDPLITNHRLKKTKPLYVNYARTAKRVDVKKLKENLWRVLTNNKRGLSVDQAEHDGDTERVEGVQRFTDVLYDLRKLYSPKVFRDISVPFCFICLLHLANERDLVIRRSSSSNGGDYDNDDDDDDDFVLGETPMDENFLNELTIVQNV